MSYCRIGEDSDVYVYGSEKHLNCMCYIFFITGSYSEMIIHLKEHLNHGDKVPSRAFNRLEHERESKGDIYQYMNTKDYIIVDCFGNKIGNLAKVTLKYFYASDGSKYLRDYVGGNFSIIKSKKLKK